MPNVIRYKSFDGLDLVAYSYGPEDAELTVLCLHGLTRNHKDFEPMIESLNAAHRYIAIDVRGRGDSQWDPNPKNYVPAVYVRDVLTLLDQLQLNHVALIGTSMGGIMSMLLVSLIPERIIGVVMNDIGPEVDPVGLARIGNYVGKNKSLPNWTEAAAAVKHVNAMAFPDFYDADWTAFAQRTCRESADGTVVMDYDPHLADAFDPRPATPATRLLAWRLFARMKKFPLLLVRGENSDLLSERVAKRMLRRHVGARMVVVPRVGHAPLLNEPVVIAALEVFLDRLIIAERSGKRRQGLRKSTQ